MCLVIDTCTLGVVFDQENSNHDQFAPVFKWILDGKGKIVLGGSKYNSELREAASYLRLFIELGKINKVVHLDDATVDSKAEELVETINDKKFDDPHIMAIVLVGRIRLVCTDDGRAIPFLTNRDFYGNGVKAPKIYSGKRNSNLLCDKNIASCCNPTTKLNRKVRRRITELVKSRNKW